MKASAVTEMLICSVVRNMAISARLAPLRKKCVSVQFDNPSDSNRSSPTGAMKGTSRKMLPDSGSEARRWPG